MKNLGRGILFAFAFVIGLFVGEPLGNAIGTQTIFRIYNNKRSPVQHWVFSKSGANGIIGVITLIVCIVLLTCFCWFVDVQAHKNYR